MDQMTGSRESSVSGGNNGNLGSTTTTGTSGTGGTQTKQLKHQNNHSQGQNTTGTTGVAGGSKTVLSAGDKTDQTVTDHQKGSTHERNDMKRHEMSLARTPSSLHIIPFNSLAQPHYLKMSLFLLNINRFLKELHTHTTHPNNPNNNPNSNSSNPGSGLPLVYRQLLSLLFDWETSVADVDSRELADIRYTLTHHLKLKPPTCQNNLTFGAFSDNGQALCVLFPRASKGQGYNPE